MHSDIRVIRECNFGFGRVQQMIGINAVNDVHLMSGVTERMAKAIEIHRIAAETVWWIKGRKMQEIERTIHCAVT